MCLWKKQVLSYGYPMDILWLSYGEGPTTARKRLVSGSTTARKLYKETDTNHCGGACLLVTLLFGIAN